MNGATNAERAVLPTGATTAHVDDLLTIESVPGTKPEFRVRYWPFLDGVRGISILAVLAVHLQMPFAPSGYFGVDLFFGLSGFLITLLLVEEWKRSGTIRLRDFYLRRVLRLVPALVSVVVVTVVWTFVAKPQQLTAILQCAASALTYITNWAWAFGWIGLTPLTHTWSLAIEEQFYLLWPLFLLALLRRSVSNRARVATVLIAACSSIALRTTIALTTNTSMRSYVGIDTRADGLLLGCAAALLLTWNMVPASRWIERIVRAGAIVAILFLGYMIATSHPPSAYVVYGIASVAFAVAWLLFSLFYAPVAFVRYVLSSPPLVWLGRRAYGIYLWHFPFILLPLPVRVPPAFAALLSIGVAAISFVVIERPFLRLKHRRTVVAPHDRFA